MDFQRKINQFMDDLCDKKKKYIWVKHENKVLKSQCDIVAMSMDSGVIQLWALSRPC